MRHANPGAQCFRYDASGHEGRSDMKQAWMLGSLAICVACHSERPAAPPPTPPPAVQLPPPPAPGAQPELVVEQSARPDNPCIVKVAELKGRIPVRLSANLEPFAWLRKPRAALHVKVGNASRAQLELEKEGVVFTLRYVARDLPLRPTRPIVFAGHVVPNAYAEFGLLSATAESVTVSYQLSAAFKPAAPLHQQVQCGDLAFERTRFDPRKATKLGKPSGEGSLPAGRELPFHDKPGAPEITRHTLARASGVDIHEARDGFSLVAFTTQGEFVFGWVPSSLLSPGVGGIGLGSIGTIGRHGFGTSYKSHIGWVSCDRDLELFARLGEESGRVGTIRAGTRFEPGSRQDARTKVKFWAQWLRVAPKAKLSVDSDALEHCAPLGRP